MRQSTLSFGQRPLETPPVTQPEQQPVEEIILKSKDKVHPFFGKRPHKEEKNDVKGKSRAISTSTIQPPAKKQMLNGTSKSTSTSKHLQTPWPGKGESLIQPDDQLQSSFSHVERLTAFEKRDDHSRTDSSIEDDEHTWSWLRSTNKETSGFPGEKEDHRLPLQDGNLACPVDFVGHLNLPDIQSLKQARWAASESKSNAKSSSMLWIDKWRPKEAAHVLGNEERSSYMRSWLESLKVGDRLPNMLQKSQSRQIIKRAPTKKRGRTAIMKEMDDFIVGDNAEEEAWFDQFRKKDSVSDSPQENSTAKLTALADQDALTNRLTNVIVIEGPSGCGKTSAVYACANELGFEVFEIFPGMGKRSGVALSAMVGDLSRNHMVSSGGTGGGAFQGKFSTNLPNGREAARSNESKARQSLILVEEVDTLYEDDKGFWQGLIELAGQSLRPIILTCNDISTVSIQALPVQKVLKFIKPPNILAVEYLQRMCFAEGYEIDPAKTLELYKDHNRAEEQLQYNEQLILPMHGPLVNLQMDDLVEDKCDLRQSIMQLQYDCETMRSSSKPAMLYSSQHKTLRQLIRSAELESFANSTFTRSFDRAAAEWEFEQYAPSPDDVQMAGKAIYHSSSKGTEVCLPMYGREQDYVSILTKNAEGWVDSQFSDRIQYHHSRATLSKDIDDILEIQNVSFQSRMPSLEGVLDYAPFIHKIVSINDQEEEIIRQSVEEMLKEGLQGESDLISKGYSRQKINLINKQDRDGLLYLTVQERDFYRWLWFDKEQFDRVRQFAPRVNW